MTAVLLMIDNYDSFTFNLVQYFRELRAEVHVVHNDELGLAEIEQLQPQHLVISPGPCTPDEAGISVDAIRRFAGRIPILGVCLGHQAIGQAFGAKVVRARQVMHGKVSAIHHAHRGVFAGLDEPFPATRYHSLVLDRQSLPGCLEITAWTGADPGVGEIMGIKHTNYALEGVQFHPEAILSEQGHRLLENFLRQ